MEGNTPNVGEVYVELGGRRVWNARHFRYNLYVKLHTLSRSIYGPIAIQVLIGWRGERPPIWGKGWSYGVERGSLYTVKACHINHYLLRLLTNRHTGLACGNRPHVVGRGRVGRRIE